MSAHAAILEAVLANPSDPVPKLVLADFFDECGEWQLASAYRWCATHGKHPMMSAAVAGDWVWFSAASGSAKSDKAAELPSYLHSRMIRQRILDERRFGQIRSHSFAEAMQAIADHLEPIE